MILGGILLEEVYIKESLSSRKIIDILENNPDLNKIKCPNSLYLRMSKKYLKVLNDLEIEIEPLYNSGRPKKYKQSDIKEINKLINKGIAPKEIAERLNISVKSVYYLKDKPIKRGRKQKYATEVKANIRESFNSGISAKELSHINDIPLRTIYSIIT
jgi:hypothetical protein